MATILLKNLTDKINIIEQQNFLLSYAKKNMISIEATELETSDHKKKLEEKMELKGFLRSLKEKDTLLVYDFWVLSSRVDELVKILECILQRNISLHVCSKKVVIDSDSSVLYVLEVLSKERALGVEKKKNAIQGRPKGRMSRSKFDKFRSEIISYLEQGYPVTKIAALLDVRRTSLKDYINSRNLKVLAKTKQDLLGATPKKIKTKKIEKKECDLVAFKGEKI